MGFKIKKILLSIIATGAAAYVGTFYRDIELNIIAGGIGIISIVLIYKHEIKWLFKNKEKILR
uniref:Uncharacterized protein n=1 Tax=Fervidobacterium pennivorans TaxID=93466 RepID=A0A7V4NED0_FERPE